MYPLIYHSKYITIPTYLLVISLTYSIGLLWIVKRSEQRHLDRNITLDICLAVMVGGFLGARLTHIIWEHPQFYIDHPMNIFKFWLGGYVFYGGAIGAIIGTGIVIKRKSLEWGTWLDLFAPVLAAGYAIGRIGCFLAGCCYGRECHLPWAVTFPQGVEAPAGVPIHPSQLYATLFEILVLGVLLFIEKKRHQVPFSKMFLRSGSVFYTWMILHGFGRILMENFRSDFRGSEILGLSLSTTISLLIICFGIFLLIRGQKRKGAK